MPTEPHQTLLDRSSAAAEMATQFAPQLLLLEDMANYGSHLILQVLDRTPDKTLRNLIVGAGLLKQFVTMLDATAIALREGAVYAAHLPARTAFEASLCIRWLLQPDGEKKAA